MLLRRALLGNAAFSGLSGAAFLLAGGEVARVLGDVPPPAVRLVGAGLLVFAGLVATLARRPRRTPVIGVVAADGAWVAGSLVLLALGPAWLSATGGVLVAAVAAVVAGLAALQAMGARRLPKERPV